jgi:hypothetical protein
MMTGGKRHNHTKESSHFDATIPSRGNEATKAAGPCAHRADSSTLTEYPQVKMIEHNKTSSPGEVGDIEASLYGCDFRRRSP